ncbi:MAG: hypothetical protein LUC45_00780 [Paraprevotella sp.]|nr:hypothetical protein [Paraprevotella sp.]
MEKYTAKVYEFKEETAGSDQFVYADEQDITSSTFTTGNNLDAGTRYRFVFMALPKGQTPALPTHTTDKPIYTDADLSYINGNQTGNEVFRNILTFTPQGDNDSYNVILTRQNGALQVRLDNNNGALKSVKLEVEGMPDMYLNDGTGGKVLTKGTVVQLSKEDGNPDVTDDYRITVNRLPAEDVTGKGGLTLTYQDGSTKVYNLTSSQGSIPIYPNQVTWLTLSGAGDDNFKVEFGPTIDLDDDQWDGYNK